MTLIKRIDIDLFRSKDYTDFTELHGLIKYFQIKSVAICIISVISVPNFYLCPSVASPEGSRKSPKIGAGWDRQCHLCSNVFIRVHL